MKIDNNFLKSKSNIDFDNLEKMFAVLPKKFFFDHTHEITPAATPQSLKRITLSELSPQKIISYIEQKRLVLVDEDDKILNEADLAVFLEELLEFLKAQEAGKSEESEKSEKIKKIFPQQIKDFVIANKNSSSLLKILQGFNAIFTKHNKIVRDNIESESKNDKAVAEKYQQIKDQILYYIRMKEIKSEAEDKIS